MKIVHTLCPAIYISMTKVTLQKMSTNYKVHWSQKMTLFLRRAFFCFSKDL